MNEGTKLTVVIEVEPSKAKPGAINVQYAEIELPPGAKMIRTWDKALKIDVGFGQPPNRPAATSP